MGRSRMGPAVRMASSRSMPSRRSRRTRSIISTATVIIMPVRITTARIDTVEKVWPARSRPPRIPVSIRESETIMLNGSTRLRNCATRRRNMKITAR